MGIEGLWGGAPRQRYYSESDAAVWNERNASDSAFASWLNSASLGDLERAYSGRDIYVSKKRYGLWKKIVQHRARKHRTSPEDTVPPDIWEGGMSDEQFDLWIKGATRAELEYISDEIGHGRQLGHARMPKFEKRVKEVGGLRPRERARVGPTGKELVKHGGAWVQYLSQLVLGFGLLGGGTMLAGGAAQEIQNGELDEIFGSGKTDIGFILLAVGAFVCIRAGLKWLNSDPPSMRRGRPY